MAGIVIIVLISAVAASSPELQSVGSDSLNALVTRLKGRDLEDRNAAAEELRLLGPQAAESVPALMAAMSHGEVMVRVLAANCLGHVGPRAEAAIPLLSRLLKDEAESEIVRSTCGYALATIGPDALDELLEALEPQRDLTTRTLAASAIGKLGPKASRAVPQLVAVLADDESDIWHTAYESLVAIGADAIPALRRALESPNARFRVRAGQTLLELEPGQLLSVRALIKDLTHTDVEVRRDAAYALYYTGRDVAAETVPPLTKALKDEDAVVREYAARDLWGIGRPALTALPALVAATRDPAPEVRGYVARALGSIGVASEAVIDALRRGVDDEEVDVRMGAVRSLGDLGPDAVSSGLRLKLRAILGEPDPDEDLQWEVEQALAKLNKH